MSKIILIIFIIIYLLSYPYTKLANWGERVFKSYKLYLVLILLCLLTSFYFFIKNNVNKQKQHKNQLKAEFKILNI